LHKVNQHLVASSLDWLRDCYDSQISLVQICKTTLKDSGELELLEQIYGLHGIKDVTSWSFPQQLEAQSSLPTNFSAWKAAGGVG